MLTRNQPVKIIHGPNDDFLDVAGMAVATIKENLRDAFNIPTEAIAFVNGALVDSSYRLLPNDTLEFVKRRGEKSILDPDERAQLDRIEAMLNKLFANPADAGSPGRSVETLEIAVFINQLRQQGVAWKKVLKACRERWPDDNHVRNVEQVWATALPPDGAPLGKPTSGVIPGGGVLNQHGGVARTHGECCPECRSACPKSVGGTAASGLSPAE